MFLFTALDLPKKSLSDKATTPTFSDYISSRPCGHKLHNGYYYLWTESSYFTGFGKLIARNHINLEGSEIKWLEWRWQSSDGNVEGFDVRKTTELIVCEGMHGVLVAVYQHLWTLKWDEKYLEKPKVIVKDLIKTFQ